MPIIAAYCVSLVEKVEPHGEFVAFTWNRGSTVGVSRIAGRGRSLRRREWVMLESLGTLGILFGFLVFLFFAGVVLYVIIKARYKKAGPDEALIIFGKRKIFGKKVHDEDGNVEAFRIIRGGGSFVVPAWESHELLSLKMMTLDIDLQHVYTAQGIPINVRAVAQVKVQGDIPHIRRAAEGFLGVSPKEVQ